jgi:hypothetical protein
VHKRAGITSLTNDALKLDYSVRKYIVELLKGTSSMDT